MAGTADPPWPKEYHIAYGIMFNIKSWVKEEEVRVFVLPSHCYFWWSLAFPEVSKHLPACGNWWMNSLPCFACAGGFCFIYYIVFISSHKYSNFYPSDSLLHPTREEYGCSCMVLNFWLWLNHETAFLVTETSRYLFHIHYCTVTQILKLRMLQLSVLQRVLKIVYCPLYASE